MLCLKLAVEAALWHEKQNSSEHVCIALHWKALPVSHQHLRLRSVEPLPPTALPAALDLDLVGM